MPRPWTIAGIALLFCGGLLTVSLTFAFPELPGTCTDIAYAGEGSPGGFEFYGFDLLVMEYSPDGGVNHCRTPYVSLAFGLLGLGGAVLAADRHT
jgi:hypothetical protein